MAILFVYLRDALSMPRTNAIYLSLNIARYVSHKLLLPTSKMELKGWACYTTKKYTSVMIRVCHSRSRFLSCMYIHDKFMTESR